MARRFAPTEAKTHTAAVAAYLAGVGGLAVLQAVNSDHGALFSGLPQPLPIVVYPIVAYLVTFLGGWVTKHTPRDPATVPGGKPTSAGDIEGDVSDADDAEVEDGSDVGEDL